MNNQIDLTQPIAKIVEQHPEMLEFLVDFGFKPLANPAMRNTVGRITSPIQGCQLIGRPLAELIQELEWNGYTVITGEHHAGQ